MTKTPMFGRPRAALSAPCHLGIRRVSSLKPAAVQPLVGSNHRFQHAVARKVHQTLAASGALVHRWFTMWMTHFWTLAGSQKSGIDRKCVGGGANTLTLSLPTVAHTYMKFVH